MFWRTMVHPLSMACNSLAPREAHTWIDRLDQAWNVQLVSNVKVFQYSGMWIYSAHDLQNSDAFVRCMW